MTRDQNILVEENLGLVGYMIKRVFKGVPKLGCMDYDDLFQIGAIGLCKAAKSYKDDGRATFGTYACVVIRNEFYKAIEKESHPESVELTETIPASESPMKHHLSQRLFWIRRAYRPPIKGTSGR